MGAFPVRLSGAPAGAAGAGERAPAPRGARPRLRVPARRAGGPAADRAADARLNRGPMPRTRAARTAALARLALRVGGRYARGWARVVFASGGRRRGPRPGPAFRRAAGGAAGRGGAEG